MDISIVIPTFNECGNVEPTFKNINKVLSNYEYQIIFVDDGSDDGTPNKVRELKDLFNQILLLERKGKKELSSAIAHGFNHSQGKLVAVMDADLSYDFEILPLMIEKISQGNDIVLGSRYLNQSDTYGFAIHRKIISKVSSLLASINLDQVLTDPTTGYAIIRKEKYDEVKDSMKLIGFKFVYELIVLAKDAKIIEVGTFFKDRVSGRSKFSIMEIFKFILLVIFLRFR